MAKQLRVVLGRKELARLYARKPLVVRTPKGEELTIVFALTVGQPVRQDGDDIFSLLDQKLAEIDSIFSKIGKTRR